VNLHLYHYAANNPVKYVDPDGKYLGLKNRAQNFKNILLDELAQFREQGNYDFRNALSTATTGDIGDSKNAIPSDSQRPAYTDLGMTVEEYQNYSQDEMARSEAFANIRGQDELSYGVAGTVLTAAESRFTQAEREALHARKTRIEAKRYAENEANKIIDNFTGNNNPNYIPPDPLPEK
jgi:hypothetical protein